MSSQKLPTFLIIGATKGGTTSLYNYLNQHPQIFMSEEKEPHFFAFENKHPDFKGPGADEFNAKIFTNFKSYQHLFQESTGTQARGEASAMYIYYSNSPHSIKKHLGEQPKLILILRNPVDRAYSSYLHLVRDGLEDSKTFRIALEQEKERKERNWLPLFFYKELGLYDKQLKHYYSIFNRENIKTFLFDDLITAPNNVYNEICSFINVDPSFTPDFGKKYNVSGVPKNKTLHEIYLKFRYNKSFFKHIKPLVPDRLKNIIMKKNLQKIPMTIEDRQHLTCYYKNSIIHLQDIIRRDLSGWLTPQ